MEDKLISLQEAAEIVKDGSHLAIGGNVLHRAPMAFIRQLLADGKKGLHLIKTAGAHDVDLLCAGGCVDSVDAGFISYETKYGLAMHYRKAVEAGTVKANEHACYTVISALRAAVCGVPYMPVRGLVVSDLLKYNDYFEVMEDPFGSGPVAVVKALVPDVAVLHVQKCDRQGNAIIEGPLFEDVLMAKAAKKVIVTAETIVPNDHYQMNASTVTIPHFLVDAVVHAPKGAAPCSCYGRYDINDTDIRDFKQMKSREDILAYADKYNRNGQRKGAGK